MKKLLITALAVLGFTALQAQEGELNVGANIGIPVGDASDFTGVAIGVEGNYLFTMDQISSDFKLGPSVGIVHYTGKDYEIPVTTYNFTTFTFEEGTTTIEGASFTYLPIAAAGRYSVSQEFTVGLDLGFAVGVSDAAGTGLYFRPLVGYNVNEQIMVQAAYSGVSKDGFTVASFGVGAMYTIQ